MPGTMLKSACNMSFNFYNNPGKKENYRNTHFIEEQKKAQILSNLSIAYI